MWLVKFHLWLCSLCSVLPTSWSMSINLSRKSLTEATLRRMMGWRGAIHCSFPWPSWRPRFPTLCKAWRPRRHKIHSTLTSPAHQTCTYWQNSVWVTAYLKVRDQKGPWGQACCEALCPAHAQGGSPSLHTSLKLGFEPESGRSHTEVKIACSLLCRGPMATALQYHGQQMQSHTWKSSEVLLIV